MKPGCWHIAVLIPARDEEELLPRCLRSVEAARRCLPPGVTSDIVVVCDCCGDRTGQVAGAMLQGRGCVVHTGDGSVGSARALAARTALARYAGAPDRCWLANTDADCDVPVSWLCDQLMAAERGITALAGIIDVDHFKEHGREVQQRFRQTYRTHADGTHPHVHAANLGVRADTYLRAGGWSHLITGEDHDLWGRLKRCGARLQSDASLEIITSGRRTGRAPLGFADALAAHNDEVA